MFERQGWKKIGLDKESSPARNRCYMKLQDTHNCSSDPVSAVTKRIFEDQMDKKKPWYVYHSFQSARCLVSWELLVFFTRPTRRACLCLRAFYSPPLLEQTPSTGLWDRVSEHLKGHLNFGSSEHALHMPINRATWP